MTPNPEAVNYASYLKLDELLALQQPRDDVEHDEMLFIVIHQVYELWFKVVLHEVDYCCRLLKSGDAPRARHTLKRILTILKVLVAQLDILETMSPIEFLTFRDHLDTASGFQSHQFRALEFCLGWKEKAVLRRLEPGSSAWVDLERRLAAPTLWDCFLHYLAKEGYDVPRQTLERDVTRLVAADDAVQAILLDIYRRDSRNAQLCERLVDLDEGLQEWRYRHMKMVERTIGRKRGTGGSAGSRYLATTLNKPVFPDLWEIRARL